MPAGMQCWDANGKLVVDIGDYNCRLIGSTSLAYPINTYEVMNNFSGISANGSFATVSATTSPDPYSVAEFAVRTYDNGFRVFCTSPGNAAATLTINIYGFL